MGGLTRPAPPIITTGMPLGRWQVPKPKLSKPHAQRSGANGVDDSPIRPQMFHLNSIPIADPWHEKKMFEAGEFTRKLNPDYAGAIVAQNEDDLWRRIIEVYRQCYESADSTSSRLRVVRNFAAHFPDRIFDAWWIKELVKREHPEHSFSKVQKELFRQIQNGLRSAVDSQPRESAVQRYFDIAGAQMAKRNIQDELTKWNEGLQRDLDHSPEWIAERAAEKADELLQRFSIRSQLAKQRLTEFLNRGHCYEAAVLITAEKFNVQEHDLESKLK